VRPQLRIGAAPRSANLRGPELHLALLALEAHRELAAVVFVVPCVPCRLACLFALLAARHLVFDPLTLAGDPVSDGLVPLRGRRGPRVAACEGRRLKGGGMGCFVLELGDCLDGSAS